MVMSSEFNDFLKGIEEELIKFIDKSKMVGLLLRKNYQMIKDAFYDDENPQEVVNKIRKTIKESIKDDELLTESSKMDLPTRTVVKDLLLQIKKGPGQYYLPEEIVEDEMYYIFNRLPEFTVELLVREDMSIKDDYLMDGHTSGDGDTIEIILIKNPTKFPEAYYDLVADLNDIVRHELEHVLQEFGYRDISKKRKTDSPNDKEYYKQKHEIPAEVAGFRRIVKLRKETPEKVIRDWFNRNKEIHQLDDSDINEIVDFLTNEYKKKYG